MRNVYDGLQDLLAQTARRISDGLEDEYAQKLDVMYFPQLAFLPPTKLRVGILGYRSDYGRRRTILYA